MKGVVEVEVGGFGQVGGRPIETPPHPHFLSRLRRARLRQAVATMRGGQFFCQAVATRANETYDRC